MAADVIPNQIVVVGCCRDVEKTFEGIYQTINQLQEFGYSLYFVICENGSEDSTKALLQGFDRSSSMFTWLELEPLNEIVERTVRLEHSRNIYLEYIRNHPVLSLSEFMLVVDWDDVNQSFFDINGILEAFDFLNSNSSHAAVCANQQPKYYDLWALRSSSFCQGDMFLDLAQRVFWAQTLDESVIESSLFGKMRDFSLPASSTYIEVESAFGGLGIYKMSSVLESASRYLGSEIVSFKNSNGQSFFAVAQVCEHVRFHGDIRRNGGRIFVKTDLINMPKCGIEASPYTVMWLYRWLNGNLVFNPN